MRILEVAEVLCFGRVRGPDLARLDLKLRLTESTATKEFVVWRRNVSIARVTGATPVNWWGHLHGGHLSGRTRGFCFLGSPERIAKIVATAVVENPDGMIVKVPLSCNDSAETLCWATGT